MTDFKSVFNDTAPFIYYFEYNEQYYEKVRNFFMSCYERNIQMVTSSVTIEEYCVFPYECGDIKLIDKFEKGIMGMGIRVIDIDTIIAKRAAELRAKYQNFKAMDALQIAAAIKSNCDLFFTNDKQLKQEKELPCITMEHI